MDGLINIGCNNFIAADKLVSVVAPDAAPVRRVVAAAKDSGKLIDATCGRKTKSVLFMSSDHIILSCIDVCGIESKVQECIDKEKQ